MHIIKQNGFPFYKKYENAVIIMTKAKMPQEAEETSGKNRFSIEISYSGAIASVIVCDAVGVCEADADRIRLITKRGGILISGNRLSVTALYDRALEITGVIYEMKFGKRAGGAV